MQDFLSNEVAVTFVVTALALIANLLFLWGYSGAVRVTTKTAMNPEDAASVAKGVDIVTADPPEVARVLRAHANGQAVIYPFLFVGFLYVLAGPSKPFATCVFVAFVVFRLAHSLCYLKAIQPARTLTFVGSALALLVMTGDLVRLVITRA